MTYTSGPALMARLLEYQDTHPLPGLTPTHSRECASKEGVMHNFVSTRGSLCRISDGTRGVNPQSETL